MRIDLENEKDKNIINTQDNLSPEVFKNILQILGLEYKVIYETKEKFINLYLLTNRNSIGHGSKELFKDEEFELEIKSLKRLRDIILVIIESFRDELAMFAKEELFLKINEAKAKQITSDFEIQLKEQFEFIEKTYNE